MIKNTLPDKSGNPESIKKSSQQFESFSTTVPIVDEAEGILQVVLFTVLWFKWSVKRRYAAKVLLAIWDIFTWIVTVIPTNVVTNSL